MLTWPTDSRALIVAEAGVNHNGDRARAMQLIDIAADSGADAVKFQTFRAELVASRHAPKAAYQRETTDARESQLEMIRALELSDADHFALVRHANRRGIAFLSTPFDLPSVAFLTEGLGLDTIKVASGEITNAPLLLAVARAGRQVILSTGMSTLGEIEAALGVLAFGFLTPKGIMPASGAFSEALASEAGWQALRQRVVILHCTTEYPAPFSEANLRAIGTLTQSFGLRVGYSDHTPGIHVTLAAVACGAQLIEKHFTVDRNLPGPDHRASLEPAELGALVRQVRNVETALGHGLKRPSPSEWANRDIARKSILAARTIAQGELITEDSIITKRPGTGISPMRWYEVLGRPATRSYEPEEFIDP